MSKIEAILWLFAVIMLIISLFSGSDVYVFVLFMLLIVFRYIVWWVKNEYFKGAY